MGSKSGVSIDVGSVVRLNRPRPRKGTAKAMVAEMNDNNGGLTLFWEPIAPRPIGKRKLSNFFVTPKRLLNGGENPGDEEISVSADEVMILLPFEVESDIVDADTEGGSKTCPEDVAIWKSRGDQLLKLGDPSAAASYYEEALYVSSHLSVGSTIITSVNGFPRLCEVDCVEDDESTVDVTFLIDGEERQLKKSQVLLALMEGDADKLQERILLNITRCMLLLADLDGLNRQTYAKAAVLGATVAMTIANLDVDEGLPPHTQTAMQLRCKAYMMLSKWKNTLLDCNRLIDVGNKEGKKLLATLEQKKQSAARTNKMLAREMCKFVESASHEG